MNLSSEEWAALTLSLQVSFCAVLFSLPLAVFVAWILARWSFPGKSIVSAIVHLPLVLPVPIRNRTRKSPRVLQEWQLLLPSSPPLQWQG